MPQYDHYKNEKLFGFSEEIVELKPNDTFISLFSNKDAADTTKLFHNPLFRKLNEKYKEIFIAGKEAGLADGEIQMIIYLYSNGKPLHEIEYSRLDEIIIFIKTNIDKILSSVNPDLHAFLLRTQYYKKDKKELVKPYRMAKTAKIIKSLFGQKESRKKLIKFSEILSRL